MLEEMAGEPRDMGLSEQELCPDPLVPGPILADGIFFIGDPDARFMRAFSPSVTGDIAASIPMRARLKGRTEMGANQHGIKVFCHAKGLSIQWAA